MIASKVYHFTIGMVAEQASDSTCPRCWRDVLVFTDRRGSLDVFEFFGDEPHQDGSLVFGWDKHQRVDGWLALRVHVCPEDTEKGEV